MREACKNRGEEWRKHIAESLRGHAPWNKGLKGKQIAWNKGLKGVGKGFTGRHTEESKWKMSLAKLGKPSPLKGKKAPWHDGNQNGFKEGQIPWNKGMSGFMGGEMNPRWKGGITKQNKLEREHHQYKTWRKTVFARDGYKCRMPDCDGSERYLEAHHIERWSEFPELRYEMTNGITLCKKCHNKTKGKEKEYRLLFLYIIKA